MGTISNTSSFSFMHVGSIARYIEPVSINSEVEWVLDYMDSEGIDVVPVEKNGAVIGLVSKSDLLASVDTAIKKIFHGELEEYVVDARLVDALDYVDVLVAEALDENRDSELSGWFIVEYRKSFAGIISLREMIRYLNEINRREMERAREMQATLLRHRNFASQHVELSFYNRMAYMIGGDFFSFSELAADGVMASCFDVMGKNVSAALATSALGAVFSMIKRVAARRPEETVALVNNVLADILPADVFVAGIFIFVSPSSGCLIFNCGFPVSYAFVQDGGQVSIKRIKANLPPLGMDSNLSVDCAFKLDFQPGMRIFAYSDGISDILDMDGRRFGDERVLELFKSAYKNDFSSFDSLVDEAVNTWISKGHLADDITMINLMLK
ncbi:SpoIIE family protein phosphatase [Spirochaetia bacterium 38H-sp]|uniref:SpoIIE family protein phosphatase n=1 Tax=Rarispira pelagica TaxID=3141764 RepID=A0ABU9UAH0_9SPIR